MALPAKGGPQRTLLIAVRKGCPACDADAASLRVLKARAEAGQVPVRILVPDRSSLDDAYLGRFGGAAGDATLVSFAELGIGAVPAVIEVGPDSVVTRSWMGRVEKQLAQWTF